MFTHSWKMFPFFILSLLNQTQSKIYFVWTNAFGGMDRVYCSCWDRLPREGSDHFGHLPKPSQSQSLNARWNGSVATGMGSQLSQSASSWHLSSFTSWWVRKVLTFTTISDKFSKLQALHLFTWALQIFQMNATPVLLSVLRAHYPVAEKCLGCHKCVEVKTVHSSAKERSLPHSEAGSRSAAAKGAVWYHPCHLPSLIVLRIVFAVCFLGALSPDGPQSAPLPTSSGALMHKLSVYGRVCFSFLLLSHSRRNPRAEKCRALLSLF